jgi:hypothetical protein
MGGSRVVQDLQAPAGDAATKPANVHSAWVRTTLASAAF